MIKTLSIPKELQEFLDDNPDLSPSKMLQSKIIEIKENRKIRNIVLENAVKMKNHLQKELWKANDKIEFLEKRNSSLDCKGFPKDDGGNKKLT